MTNRIRFQRFKEIVSLIYVFSLCYILPLIVHNGYYDLGTTKMQVLIYINMVFFGGYILMQMVAVFAKPVFLKKVYFFDLLMILWLAVLVISFAQSPYKDYIFWGAPGWGMGFIPCLLFVWSYFFVSNMGIKKDTLIRILAYSVFIPALIGFCNGLHIDVLGMNKGLSLENRFFMISTIGNTTWYTAYICVFLPFVLCLCFKAKDKWERIIAISNVIFCIGSVLLAKTDSGYFTLFFVLMLSLCILDQNRKKWWKSLIIGGVVITICAVLLLILNTFGLFPEMFSKQLVNSYFFYNDAWGNSRGFLWKVALKIYAELPIQHKMLGVGPDGFGAAFLAYLTNHPEMYSRYVELYGQQIVVNAHNEYLNQLISLGVLGFSVYLCIGGSILWQVRSKNKEKECENQFYNICIIGIIAYYIHTIVSYAQPCATPYLYIILGFVRWDMLIYKRGKKKD